MAQNSAGLMLFKRVEPNDVRILLGHPGGPFFARKDEGSWTIPKGLVEDGEESLEAARREFTEETGLETPDSGYVDLGEMSYKSGKRVLAWAFEGECDPSQLESNTFQIEWPPKSGKKATFPEIDRFALYSVGTAVDKIHPAQLVLIERLLKHLVSKRT